VAGHAIGEPEKAAQERLLRFRKQPHVDRALPAAQNRAQRYRQNLMKVVQRRIAGARVPQTVPAFDKSIQNILPRRQPSDPVESSAAQTQNPPKLAADFQMRFPWVEGG
jgi:hypothetical protein